MAWRRFLYDVAMLSKWNLQSFLQCARKLWLERHNPDVADLDDSSTRRREIDGNLVGEKARQQLGNDFIWPPGRDDQAAAAEEAKSLLRRSPQLSAAEVPMVHGGLYARADALVRDQDGYILRETKASSFPLKADKVTPDKPEEHHLNDISIQAWVMSNSGLPMTRSELNLLNSRWRYSGNGDYAGLFRQMDVSAQIGAKLAGVPAWVEAAERTLRGDMPEIQTGRQCHDPDECPIPGASGNSMRRLLRIRSSYCRTPPERRWRRNCARPRGTCRS